MSENNFKCGAIVCEFNPMHNGHKILIEKMRERGVSHIICIMSGCFVQRGDPAIFLPQARVECALASGADLVLQLPAVYAISTADNFAKGAIEILDSLGCVSVLGFGVESDEEGFLRNVDLSENLRLENEKEIIQLVKKGISYPKAVYETVKKYGGEEYAEIFSDGNNILGLQYIKALSKTSIQPMPIKRQGAGHDSLEISGKNVSSSYLRRLIYSGQRDEIYNFIPEESRNIVEREFSKGRYIDQDVFGRMIMLKLRDMETEDFEHYFALNGSGLEKRMEKEKNCADYSEFLSKVKTKRYTMSSIKRSVIHYALNIKYSEGYIKPLYAEILGMNQNGREILNKIKIKNGFSVNSSLFRLSEKNLDSKKLAKIENKAYNLYTLCLNNPINGGFAYTHKIITMR